MQNSRLWFSFLSAHEYPDSKIYSEKKNCPRDWRLSRQSCVPNWDPETLRNITALYGIEGFKVGLELAPHYAEKRQSLGISRNSFAGRAEASKSMSNPRAERACTEKTIFPFPFTLNGIWSWWQFSYRFWTIWISMWFKIDRKISALHRSVLGEKPREH